MTTLTSGNISINIASSYAELKVSQFLKLNNRKNDSDLCEILSIISDKDYKFWNDCDVTEVSLEHLLAAIAWANTSPDFAALEVPKEINIGDKLISIPEDLSIKTLGQQLAFIQMVLPHVQQRVNETGRVSFGDELPVALAIYLQPEITGGKFNGDTLKETIKQCEDCLVMEALPVANFFLSKFLNLKNGKLTFNTRQSKSTLTRESKTLINSGT